MAIILYGRVSTLEQTSGHQLTQATKAGFQVDDAVFDNGVSGVSTRLIERQEGRRLFDKLRAGDVLVVRWIDRLGRNYYDDIIETIREFMRRGVIICTVINNMTFDGATRDPVQKAVRDALIGFMAATAQAQAEATKSAQRAGIEHAKQVERPRIPGPEAELHPRAVRSRAAGAQQGENAVADRQERRPNPPNGLSHKG